MDYDAVVIGGGLVGSAIALGLARLKQKVLVLDGGDRALRASRGNFGLVWVQGKGWNYPAYARWTQLAANLWPEFSQNVEDISGVSTGYQRSGGMHFCVDESEFEFQRKKLSEVNRHTEGQFEFEMLEHGRLKTMIPQISNAVVGASYSVQDGHVDPLGLLHALHIGMNHYQVDYQANQKVSKIDALNGGFVIESNTGRYSAGKVILCAGLGNQKLGEMVGMNIPVVVDRGQLMITERLKSFLKVPSLHVRQTTQGTLQIGDSHESVGLDDSTDPFILKKIAQRAVLMFPFLSQVKLIRAWGALRVMTPDNNPIYYQSTEFPGAYTATCHSGVTLAAAHAGPISQWILGSGKNELINEFSAERFNV